MPPNHPALTIERTLPPNESAGTAFERVAAEWRIWGYRLALKITGCPDAAADALQEAMIRAYRWRARMNEVESPRAWFRQILVRAAIDQKPLATKLAEQFPAESADPIESIHVRQTLLKLDPAHRAILALAVGEGMSYAEIAELLEIPVGTVGSRLNTAKEAFRKRWEAGQ